MAQIGTCWNQTAWAVPAWAANTWAGAVVPVVVYEPAGGGRRIYDPDDHRKKYEPLSKDEWRELDRAFRARAAPRYVAPKPVVTVTKRVTPFVPLPVPGFVPEPPQPVDRVQAAKHFILLDALESALDRIESQPQPKVDHRAALANAERLRAEMERREQDRREHARQVWEAREADRLEQERLADEDEMMGVLLLIHELS